MKGLIGLGISGLERGFGENLGVGPVVKESIGEGAAKTFMEKEEQERHSNTLVGEAIGVVVPVALHEVMGLPLA